MRVRRRCRAGYPGRAGRGHVFADRGVRLSRRRGSRGPMVPARLARLPARSARMARQAAMGREGRSMNTASFAPIGWMMVVAIAAGVIGYLLATLLAARRAEQLSRELEGARARLSSETELRARTDELLRQSEAQVRAAVESASRAALDANSETFLKLAREVFGRDQAAATNTLKEREEAIKQLVEPLKVALARQEEMSMTQAREQQESAGRITGQIENLVKV